MCGSSFPISAVSPFPIPGGSISKDSSTKQLERDQFGEKDVIWRLKHGTIEEKARLQNSTYLKRIEGLEPQYVKGVLPLVGTNKEFHGGFNKAGVEYETQDDLQGALNLFATRLAAEGFESANLDVQPVVQTASQSFSANAEGLTDTDKWQLRGSGRGKSSGLNASRVGLAV